MEQSQEILRLLSKMETSLTDKINKVDNRLDSLALEIRSYHKRLNKQTEILESVIGKVSYKTMSNEAKIERIEERSGN